MGGDTTSTIEVAQNTIVLFADIGCPWAHVAVHRLHSTRSNLNLGDAVRLDVRPFPLEIFNRQSTPKPVLDAEAAVLAGVDPAAGWQVWQGPDHAYPDTMLLAEDDRVQGSPHLFLPDGTDMHNPGIEMHWEGEHGKGAPVVDRDEPEIYEDLLRRAAAVSEGG